MKPANRTLLLVVFISAAVVFAAVVFQNQSALSNEKSRTSTANHVKTPVSRVKKNPDKKEQKFDIKILDVRKSGALSREVTARLTNKDGYSKNVRVYIELLLDGRVINVNGNKMMEIKLGNLKPGESVDKTVKLSVSFFDGLRIRSRGYVDVKLVIKWTGGRETLIKRIRL